MARSRMLRPEFFNDPDFSRLSVGARLLYLALIPHMDRNGVMLGNPQNVRSIAFPCDAKMRCSDVKKWLAEMHRHGRVILFVHNGIEYLMDPVFEAHQKIYDKDPDIYRIPVETRLQLCYDWAAKKSELNPDFLNQYQNLNLKEPDKKNQAGKGSGASNAVSHGSEEREEIAKANQKLIELRRASGLNDDGSEKTHGTGQPAPAEIMSTELTPAQMQIKHQILPNADVAAKVIHASGEEIKEVEHRETMAVVKTTSDNK